jgi:hypothetical protein
MAGSGTVGRIPSNSEHERAWGAREKKEEKEGLSFDGLPTAEEDLAAEFGQRRG